MDVAEKVLRSQILIQNYSNCEPGVSHLVDDSLRLVHSFHEPIRRSAAHVYYSAIPLTPSNSMVFKVYAPKLKNIPKLISGDGAPAPSAEIRLPSSTVSFSPDHSRLACADFHGGVEIWDIVTCLPVRAPLSGPGVYFTSINFSRDGTRFCASNEFFVVVWDATTYEIMAAILQPSGSHSFRAVWLWEDSVIVLHWFYEVSIWDVETGALVVKYKIPDDSNHVEEEALQGTYLVLPRPEQTTSIIYAITGDDVTQKYTHGRIIKEAVFSPDNTRVFCLYHDDSHVTILDVHSGSIVGDSVNVDYDRRGKFRPRIAFSPMGKRLVVLKGKSATIYNVDTGKLMHGPFERGYKIEGADLSIEETRLLLWDDWEVFEVLDVPSGNIVATGKRNTKGTHSHLISPHGDHVITYNSLVDEEYIVDEEDMVITIFNVKLLSLNDSDGTDLASVTPSPTGHQLLFTLSDNTLRLKADISSTKSVALEGARSPAAFSPEGSMIVSAYLDHALQLWGTKDTNLRAIGKSLVGHRKRVTAIAFSPTGSRLISASEDRTIRIWSSAYEGGELQRLQAYADIQLISMSSDESRIICVSRYLHVVRTLNANTGIMIGQPSQPSWKWAEFSPDGSEIIWISTDGQSRSTECQTGQITEHVPAFPTQRITEGVFSPHKTKFISISEADFIDFSDISNSCDSSSTSSAVRLLLFSPDGRWLMSVIPERFVSGSCLYRAGVWDSRSGQLVCENLSFSHCIPSMAISPSGNMVVTWGDKVCEVRDTLLGTIISRWDTLSVPKSISFSEDEKHIICILASGSSEKWDIESSALLLSSKSTGAVTAFKPRMSGTIIYVKP
jgi:WD40 repeat protein